MLEDDSGRLAVGLLAPDSVAASLQVVGERLELVAVGSTAASLIAAAAQRVKQHQQLALDSSFLHGSLLRLRAGQWIIIIYSYSLHFFLNDQLSYYLFCISGCVLTVLSCKVWIGDESVDHHEVRWTYLPMLPPLPKDKGFIAAVFISLIFQ